MTCGKSDAHTPLIDLEKMTVEELTEYLEHLQLESWEDHTYRLTRLDK